MVAKFLDLNKPKSCKVGGHKLTVPVTVLPYFFVPLSPDSRPLLCFSCYHVNHAVLTPYSNRKCFGLVQNKKWCCKSNHFALSSAIIEAAFLRHNFTPRSKIFSVLWTRVVRSELPGRSSMEGFFPTTPKNPRPIKMVFDDILSDSLCCSCGEFGQLARQTRHWHDWHSWHTYRVYMCHAISFMSYISDLEKFPISQKFFSLSRVQPFVFWHFSRIKFCFKPRRTLNGSQETLLGSFLWLDDEQ